MQQIIGREREQQRLHGILNSNKAEFLAVYGRRRVGKTYLLSNFFSSKGVYIEVSGQKNGKLAQQLDNFAGIMGKVFYYGAELKRQYSWQKAFENLTHHFDKIPREQKIILFLDELPWLASKRSGFMQSLDYMWNRHWSRDPRIKLIVCGSAASWMIDNLINAKGGLYNRVTSIMLLKPMTLAETKQYLHFNKIKFTDKQIIDIYMVMGGIPHYLNQLEINKSAVQNINRICFSEDGVLFTEFDRIFASLFNHHVQNKNIVLEISKHNYGISREELLKRLNMSSGGGFNRRITELEASGFIKKFVPYGKATKDQFFKIVDEYTMFYLRWVSSVKDKSIFNIENYWYTKVNTSEWSSWSGYAFENLCHKHVDCIISALELNNISCAIGTWRHHVKPRSKERGTQIDLIIDRSDDVIMLGEVKFTGDKFTIDKNYAMNLKNKIEIFSKYFKSSKFVQMFMITSQGLKRNIWAEELVNIDLNATEIFFK